MNCVKKYFALVMSVVLMVVMLAGCGENQEKTNSQSQASAQAQQKIEVKPLTHKRLQSVTIQDKDDGETETFSVEWNGEECTFEDDDLDVMAFLDAETNIFYLKAFYAAEPEENTPIPVHQYDEYGRVVKFWDEDDINNECIVSYDENGLPTLQYPESVREFGLNEYEFDAQKRQVTVPHAYSIGKDDDGNVTKKTQYDIRTLNENGDIIAVDSLTITTFNGEKTSEETEKDTRKYTYDENGNLLKLETKSKIMTFTYTDETIHHVWERNIPIYYTAWYEIYDYPLFWNIK